MSNHKTASSSNQSSLSSSRKKRQRSDEECSKSAIKLLSAVSNFFDISDLTELQSFYKSITEALQSQELKSIHPAASAEFANNFASNFAVLNDILQQACAYVGDDVVDAIIDCPCDDDDYDDDDFIDDTECNDDDDDDDDDYQEDSDDDDE